MTCTSHTSRRPTFYMCYLHSPEHTFTYLTRNSKLRTKTTPLSTPFPDSVGYGTQSAHDWVSLAFHSTDNRSFWRLVVPDIHLHSYWETHSKQSTENAHKTDHTTKLTVVTRNTQRKDPSSLVKIDNIGLSRLCASNRTQLWQAHTIEQTGSDKVPSCPSQLSCCLLARNYSPVYTLPVFTAREHG